MPKSINFLYYCQRFFVWLSLMNSPTVSALQPVGAASCHDYTEIKMVPDEVSLKAITKYLKAQTNPAATPRPGENARQTIQLYLY